MSQDPFHVHTVLSTHPLDAIISYIPAVVPAVILKSNSTGDFLVIELIVPAGVDIPIDDEKLYPFNVIVRVSPFKKSIWVKFDINGSQLPPADPLIYISDHEFVSVIFVPAFKSLLESLSFTNSFHLLMFNKSPFSAISHIHAKLVEKEKTKTKIIQIKTLRILLFIFILYEKLKNLYTKIVTKCLHFSSIFPTL